MSEETYEVKDGGKRIEFPGGMQREPSEGKIKWHLVASGPMLERWAEHLTKGAEKYEDDNWMRAEGDAELNRFKESAFRHFMQWWHGELDEDHAAAVLFNINGYEYLRGKQSAEKSWENILEGDDVHAYLKEKYEKENKTNESSTK